MYSFTAALLVLCVASVAHGIPAVHLEKAVKSAKESGGEIYALLVAGSNTWMNYRHQADVCHAYQIFHAHGVPDSNIVVMMYDDIAHNEQNPDPGTIINHLNGPNVYPGVPHDYTGEDVTPDNFLKILKGESPGTGSGKVIKSGPNDYVFVNFVDHGAPGFVAFPSGSLTAKQLNNAISSMHSNSQYKQMVVYVEACESGSMFDGILPTDTNVYATTAANPDESSYACYYDSKLEAYLGDCYSVYWMENVDAEGTSTETLEQQYKAVKEKTTTSHVMQYGDLSIDKELLEVFMGSKNNDSKPVEYQSTSSDAVPSGDVAIAVLLRKVHAATDYWEKKKHEEGLMSELMLRQKVRSTMEEVVHIAMGGQDTDKILGSTAQPKDFDCYMSAVDSFSQKCFCIHEVDYAMRHVYALSNLCEAGIDKATILSAIEQAC